MTLIDITDELDAAGIAYAIEHAIWGVHASDHGR